jgi:microsomal dipeptidase-like Zn-dependent dipeptidase
VCRQKKLEEKKTMQKSFTNKLHFGGAMLLLCGLAVATAVWRGSQKAEAAPPPPAPLVAELNGYYKADDGGAYFLRQIGAKLYWFAEHPNGSYANVFRGEIKGNQVAGDFWDVPKGKAQGAGQVTFTISGATLTKTSSSVPFGAKTLKLAITQVSTGVDVDADNPPSKGVGNQPNDGPTAVFKTLLPPEMRSRPEGFSGGEGNLTGAWSGDDYATYYLRETPGKDVVWFAENNFWGGDTGERKPSFARVFIGKKIGAGVVGEWVDVPKGKAKGNNSLVMGVKGAQDMTINSTAEGVDVSKLWRSLPNSLRGYADLHTHPMVHLGFGGKLIHGGPDVGSLLPADKDCNKRVRAKNIEHALGPATPTHGSPDQIICGDAFRRGIIFAYEKANDALVTVGSEAQGAPNFTGYPKWNDIAHQKMWVDWIRRSYNAGQRVMVALATHNDTLAAAVSGPGDGPTDAIASAKLQIAEIKTFVANHQDFMEIAYTPADTRRIIAANKMAIVLGVEIDDFGNFAKIPQFDAQPATARAAVIRAKVQDLYNKDGVRYIFPVHVLDNAIGGTAVYENLFNYANRREQGNWWKLQCAAKDDNIDHKFEPFLGDDIPKEAKDLLSGLSNIKVGLDVNAPNPPACGGHKNTQGLELKNGGTGDGEVALAEMMRLGMLIDVDHMSQRGVNDTLTLAEKIPGGYPLVSGHTGLRLYDHNESSRTQSQLERIGKLGGMFGLGSSGVKAPLWAARYAIANDLVGDGRVSFGTDLNGLVKGAPPNAGPNLYSATFPRSKTANKAWNYRTEGVAHYGMMADFLADVRTEPTHGQKVYANIMRNAEAFAVMWEKALKNGKGA